MVIIVRCPHCQGIAALLPVLSALSHVDFYQCGACAKVLERPKGTVGEPLPLAPSAPSSSQTRIVVH